MIIGISLVTVLIRYLVSHFTQKLHQQSSLYIQAYTIRKYICSWSVNPSKLPIIYVFQHQIQLGQVSGPCARGVGVSRVSGSAYHKCGRRAAWLAASRSGSDGDEQPCCVGRWTLFRTSGMRAARRRSQRRACARARAFGPRCGTFCRSASTASPAPEDRPPVGSRLRRRCSSGQPVLARSYIQPDRQPTRVWLSTHRWTSWLTSVPSTAQHTARRRQQQPPTMLRCRYHRRRQKTATLSEVDEPPHRRTPRDVGLPDDGTAAGCVRRARFRQITGYDSWSWPPEVEGVPACAMKTPYSHAQDEPCSTPMSVQHWTCLCHYHASW